MRKTLALIVLACLLGGCMDIPTPSPAIPTVPNATRLPITPLPGWNTPTPGTPAGDDIVQVYFTSADGATGEIGMLEEALLADINAARTQVDIAMYNLSLRRVADALIVAQQRGVKVRMVTDSDALDGAQMQRLRSAKVPLVGDRRESLMHNKFVVIDSAVVWTGSLNLTGSGTYTDNNNLMRIVSDVLAENFTTEFEEMFVNDQFGSGSPSNTPNPEMTLADGTTLENFFSPDDGISPRLVDLLEEADSSIHFLAYSFTSDPLGDVLIEQAQAGLTVRGVFDEDSYRSNTGGEYLRLQRAQLDVRLDGNPGLMHHKVMIIDGDTVVLGSYNFTRAADRNNDENVVVIHNPEIAAQYMLEFEKVYSQSQMQ